VFDTVLGDKAGGSAACRFARGADPDIWGNDFREAKLNTKTKAKRETF